MKRNLDIITIIKDDFEGVLSTINSTRELREGYDVRQIIVDSSGDIVREKIKKLILNEKNILYSWQEPSGIAAAFNHGLSIADSEWVWFLNGGDKVHQDLESKLFLDILKKSGAEVIIFELEFMQSHKASKHLPMWAMWPPIFPNWINHPATILRQRVFKKFGGFNEDYKIAMDGEIWLRVFSKDVVVDMISMPIVLFDEGGVSVSNQKETAQEVYKLIKFYLWMLMKIWFKRGKLIIDAMRYFKKTGKL